MIQFSKRAELILREVRKQGKNLSEFVSKCVEMTSNNPKEFIKLRIRETEIKKMDLDKEMERLLKDLDD